MAHHPASFSLTLRVDPDDDVGGFANRARATADAGGLLGVAAAVAAAADEDGVSRRTREAGAELGAQ